MDMDLLIFLIIGLVTGYLLGWYWLSRQSQVTLEQRKSEFDLRLRQAHDEVKAANADNQELRDRLVSLELEHQSCGHKIAELEGRLASPDIGDTVTPDASTEERASLLAKLESAEEEALKAGEAEKEANSRVAGLEWQLDQERQRRQALRSEFERIEQQLARSSLGSVQLGGESLSLHESGQSFDHEKLEPVEQTPQPLPENSVGGEDGGNSSETPIIQPLFAAQASSPTDDLKKIKGIGPVLERKLHALGIYSFAQIAGLTSAEIEKVDEVLDFKGRIEREDWVGQAKTMLGPQIS